MVATRYKKIERGKPISIMVNGEAIEAFHGESIAAAMLASGRRAFRHTVKENKPVVSFVEWVCVLTALPRLTEFHMCGHV